MFMKIALRSSLNIYFLSFCYPYERAHLILLNFGVIVVQECILTWCSWTSFLDVPEHMFFTHLLMGYPIWEHTSDVSKSRCHSYSWMHNYLMFMIVIFRPFMNNHLLPFCQQVSLRESTDLMFLKLRDLVAHKCALTVHEHCSKVVHELAFLVFLWIGIPQKQCFLLFC